MRSAWPLPLSLCAAHPSARVQLETKCLLCPFYGGALRPVLDQWIHVSCVIWLPEIGYGDTEMLSVRNLNKVNPQRLGLRCSICDTKHGACVQCSVKDCYTSMHVICAHSQGLLRMQTSLKDDVTMKQYCRKHAPPLPIEYSLTPEAERARAFAVMKHASDIGPQPGLSTVDPSPEQILQTLHRLHLELTQQSRGGNKRRRKGDQAASRADQPARLNADPAAAPARKRTLSSYSSDGEEAHGAAGDELDYGVGGSGSCERKSAGSDTDWVLRSFADELLDDFTNLGRQRGRSSGTPQGSAKDEGFWATVQPYFVPFNANQATRMLFGCSSAPPSAIDSYVQRLARGRHAATAFIADQSTASLTEAICGATLSATVDIADPPRPVQTTCPMCARVQRDAEDGQTDRLCSVCATSKVKVSMDVDQQSAECIFQVRPSGCSESKQPALQEAQSAALLDMLNLCLQIDRRSLENRDPPCCCSYCRFSRSRQHNKCGHNVHVGVKSSYRTLFAAAVRRTS